MRDYTGTFLGLAAAIALSSIVGLEIRDNQGPQENKVRDQAAKHQPQSWGTEKTQTLTSISPTTSSHQAHDGQRSDQSDSHASENDAWIWFGDGMAQWAMVAISFLTLLVSGFVACLLVATLGATKSAVRVGAKANKAAADAARAANLSNKMMENEQRPWLDVFCAVNTIAFMNVDDQVWCALSFKTTVSNLGKTPCRFLLKAGIFSLIPKSDWHRIFIPSAAYSTLMSEDLPFSAIVDTGMIFPRQEAEKEQKVIFPVQREPRTFADPTNFAETSLRISFVIPYESGTTKKTFELNFDLPHLGIGDLGPAIKVTAKQCDSSYS